jgi:hypothetical protein
MQTTDLLNRVCFVPGVVVRPTVTTAFDLPDQQDEDL